MGLLTSADKMAVMATGQDIKELPKLVTIPYGYYLHRDGKRVTRQQADTLFIPFHQARGLEFLCMVNEYSLETVQTVVYLRALQAFSETGVPETVEMVTEPQPKKAKRKKRKKKGGK